MSPIQTQPFDWDCLGHGQTLGAYVATSNKCIATSNKCLTSSNKKLLETMLMSSHILMTIGVALRVWHPWQVSKVKAGG